jgi:hypothetical protein
MVVRDKRDGRIDAGSKIRNSLKSAKTYMHYDVKLKDTKTRSKKGGHNVIYSITTFPPYLSEVQMDPTASPWKDRHPHLCLAHLFSRL